ncbi:hypothetical protein AVEN_103882-1 [Araneus ventricosus]|uniref:Uncharacterized protein n=1 Tax=Araneus ventricosus TaxID=182803 RepID=A0A4Y2SCZ3_ARAVE|nr:hypothetical protein AVEN_103882-1 [Araneus ventricosus]
MLRQTYGGDYMGEILEPMIDDIETPFKLLKEVLQPCITSEKASMLVSSILHCAVKRKANVSSPTFVRALVTAVHKCCLSGLLHQMFDVLYDGDVISVETLLEWEKSDDPNEAEGKGLPYIP